MQLMISVISAAEARLALSGGADFIDIKNPEEGSLGAQSPRVIRAIKDVCSGKAEISAAIGDMPDLQGTAALAALGAATCGVGYIKIGLLGPRSHAAALAMLRGIREAVGEFKVSIIAAGYADFERVGTLNPRVLPELAAAAGIGGCLVDTAIKNGQTLLDFLNLETICLLARQAHDAGLLFGAAGALREQDLPLLRDNGVDVAGLRSAVCRNNHRNGPLDPVRVRSLTAKLKS